uniref:Uncharacterized protein n=1 Tax=Rhizophora mucronata TaxID=61149 RepID=A0A2P2PTK5_RHIMU
MHLQAEASQQVDSYHSSVTPASMHEHLKDTLVALVIDLHMNLLSNLCK